MRNKNRQFWYGFMLILLSFTACNKEQSIKPEPITGGGNGQHKVVGRIVDINGQAISGAMVSANGINSTSGTLGQFTITGVSASDRLVVKGKQNGYFSGTATEIPSATGTTFVKITLQSAIITNTINAAAGGTSALANGSEVVIPANAIVDADGNAFSGSVNLSVAHLDPTTPEFGQIIQGADMQAVTSSGEDVTLYSYGILRVELSDGSGNELQLKSGQQATITVPIPSSMVSSAPASIPLWFFDENEGIWKEEGAAVKTGSEYIGTVSHFTDWNCDYPSPDQATITGKVVDCNNVPLANFLVKVGQAYAYTNVNGDFSRRVPSGVDLSCLVQGTYNKGFSSNIVNVTALSPGETFNAGTLALTTCPTYLTGRITNCNGDAIAGWIRANHGAYSEFFYASNGNIHMQVGTNENVNLTAFSDEGGFSTASMTTSSIPETENSIGEIMVCTPQIALGENSFVIDGGGYSNQPVTMQISNYIQNPFSTDFEYAEGLLYNIGNYAAENLLSISVSGENDLNNSLYPYARFDFNITDPTIGLGTYSIADSSEGNIYLHNAGYTQVQNYYSTSGSVTITRFDAVDGLIEGTFSGNFSSYLGGNVTISNGKFSVVRLPDNYSNFQVLRKARR